MTKTLLNTAITRAFARTDIVSADVDKAIEQAVNRVDTIIGNPETSATTIADWADDVVRYAALGFLANAFEDAREASYEERFIMLMADARTARRKWLYGAT